MHPVASSPKEKKEQVRSIEKAYYRSKKDPGATSSILSLPEKREKYATRTHVSRNESHSLYFI